MALQEGLRSVAFDSLTLKSMSSRLGARVGASLTVALHG